MTKALDDIYNKKKKVVNQGKKEVKNAIEDVIQNLVSIKNPVLMSKVQNLSNAFKTLMNSLEEAIPNEKK